jgi:hypothetical protein
MTALPELQQHIHQLRLEQSQLVLPSLPELETQIQYHSARTHSLDKVEAARHVAEIQLLLNTKAQAEDSWRRNGIINGEIKRLEQEVRFAEAEDRKHNADSANKKLNAAVEEFVSAAKQAVRAYRRAQQVAIANHAVPGASTGFGPDLSLSFLSGSPYSGFTIQQEVRMGPLPFEIREAAK